MINSNGKGLLVMETINFKTKAQLKNRVNKYVCGSANGIFSDEYWHGHKMVLDSLRAGIPGVDISLNSAVYKHDSTGTPNSKEWNYTVSHGKYSVTLIIIAAGAGFVTDPLSRYDISAYSF